MRSFTRAAFGLIGAAALATASDVHQLKKDTFKGFVGERDLVLAEFFAPWCGHCKKLEPEYEDAATQLKAKNITLAKVDCDAESDLCREYGVEGYPTLKVFRGLENIVPYNGGRTAADIVSYMTKQSLPAVSEITKEKIEEFKTADKVVLVAFHAEDDKTSSEVYSEFANEKRDDYLFGASTDADLAKAEGVSQPAIVVYKSFDEGKNTFSEKFEKEAIEKFVSKSATPLIGELGPHTYAGYMASGLPLAYIFAETEEERESLSNELRPLAEAHKGSINFVTLDASKFGQHGANLNLEVGKWPAFAIHEMEKNEKYPFDQSKKLALKDIESFVKDYAAAKLKPSVKSEPIPEKQEGPVTVVVADNYKELVLENEKDVLLEFYAPWCGYCKALAPKYEELAALYFNNPEYASKVVVAKVDATANDVPDDIKGFPTIKLFPAGGKDAPLEFDGDRSVEGLSAFIKEKGKHQVDAYEGKPADDKNATDEAGDEDDEDKKKADDHDEL